MSLLVLLAGFFLLWSGRFAPVQDFDEAANARLAQVWGWGEGLAIRQGWAKAPAPAPMTLVGINDNSITNHPWPWSPLDYSLFVQAAAGFKPEVLAIDEVLDWDLNKLNAADRRKHPQYERILRDSLLRSPKVLLASRLGSPEDSDTVQPIQGMPIIRHVTGDVRSLREWSFIEDEAKEEFRLSSTVGFVNLPTENRVVRNAPLLLRCQGNVVPTLPLQAVLLWQRLSLDDVTVVLGSHIALGKGASIPINEKGEMRVNFATPFTHIGFDELLLASEQIAANQKTQVPVDRLPKAVAMLGRIDSGATKIALGNGHFGTIGELFAATVATIQNQAYIARAPVWVSWIILGLAALVAGGAPVWKKKKVAIWSLIFVALYLIAALVLIAVKSLLLPISLPVGLALFICLYRLATPNNVWKLKRPVIF